MMVSPSAFSAELITDKIPIKRDEVRLVKTIRDGLLSLPLHIEGRHVLVLLRKKIVSENQNCQMVERLSKDYR
jgi:hypothetical protein